MVKTISPHFECHFDPIAHPDAIVNGPGVRFTVLASRLIRLEHSAAGQFEDRPSQTFWNRRQPVPNFDVIRTENTIEIITDHLHLHYTLQDQGFTPGTLAITLRESGTVWHYGDTDPANLGGTFRTLDRANGKVPLEPGLLSESGWAVVNDSYNPVFDANSWAAPRSGDALDLYFFGYGHDYLACLQEFTRVAGEVPLIPRWVLGNWWSRYWAYTQQELADLVMNFKAHDIPLSVCIVDMDWHIVDTGNASRGWTGYTWNHDLFPSPDAFIDWLHEQGLKTALNLHPADGVYPHESMYAQMAEQLGVNPASQEPVIFDIADPEFAHAYFEVLHHPIEQQGVDFWWLDWQQGSTTGIDHLDPLWWLNHLHFYDLGRDGHTRPFIFSRWGGLGNHRYPIGFSGDTYVTWKSLAFQPYFTATAANVEYGWWSHDIGGHLKGKADPELYTRWVQYGVLSPIFRLHSAKDAYDERHPWAYGADVLNAVRDAMQFRHALIPYLYTMAWRNHQDARPLITPMYYDYPERDEAYACPNQYTFGSDLIAAPYITPRDPDTRLSRQVIWLPDGDWFDFFNGQYYAGGAWHVRYGSLDDMPLFAKAGAIVPLGPTVAWGGVGIPDSLSINIFPGADNSFELYEDDGETIAYRNGHHSITRFAQAWSGDHLTFTIDAAQGDTSLLPAQRTVELVFHGIEQHDRAELRINGTPHDVAPLYNPATNSLLIEQITLAPTDTLTVTLETEEGALIAYDTRLAKTIREMLRAFNAESSTKTEIDRDLPRLIERPENLRDYWASLSNTQMRALADVLTGAGYEMITQAGPHDQIVMWNNNTRPDVTYQLATFHARRRRFESERATVPAFKAINLSALDQSAWKFKLNVMDLLNLSLSKNEFDSHH